MAMSGADNMDSKQRFSSRVNAYRDYRPRYPAAVIDLLQRECGLTPASIVADVGAGTGMLAELFLQHGNSVFAVEPNRAMRSACEELRPQYPKLTCIDGSAEATTLLDHCADFVTVGQALHWFNLDRARAEFVRILQTGGSCAVVYNERRTGGDPFHDGYERILREFGTDYEIVRSKYPPQQKLAEFFDIAEWRNASHAAGQLSQCTGVRSRRNVRKNSFFFLHAAAGTSPLSCNVALG